MQRRNAPHLSGEIRNRGRLNIISRQDLFQFIKFSNHGLGTDQSGTPIPVFKGIPV